MLLLPAPPANVALVFALLAPPSENVVLDDLLLALLPPTVLVAPPTPSVVVPGADGEHPPNARGNRTTSGIENFEEDTCGRIGSFLLP
jgi:hypothetical protein